MAQKVKNLGGQRLLGWRIHVVPDPLPKFMIEAVHHPIWISETGEKIDITPQPDSESKIVFIPDESTKLGMFRIGNKHQALINCPIVKEYIQLCNLESEQYVSKTSLIKQPIIPQEMQAQQDELLLKILLKQSEK